MINIYCFTDRSGRQMIGSVEHDGTGPNIDTVLLHNPLYIRELVDQRENKVHLIFEPIFHMYEIDSMFIKWSSVFLAPNKMIEAYEEFQSRLRAARQGIEVVPANANISHLRN